MERTTAVFREPERMNEALRDLSAHGIVKEHEVVPPENAPPRHPPRSLFGLPHSVHYAGAGAAIGMFIAIATNSSPYGNPLTTLWAVIVGAVLGILLGGFLGSAVGGIKRQRWRERMLRERWLLRVFTATRDDADRAELTLKSYGADIVQPS